MSTKKNALISVYNKDGIVEFAQELIGLGWNIISSGGTAKVLKKASVDVTDVAEISGLEAILDHRVVTLVPEIHGGLLAADKHLQELQELGYPWIDMVCADFYPMEDAIAKEGATKDSVIEQTDIGGPTMARSAAKGKRIVIVEPADRSKVITWLKDGEQNPVEFRNMLAAKAEFVVANYCLASANFLSNGDYAGFIGTKSEDCPYGENPQQSPASAYVTDDKDSLGFNQFSVIEGKPLSFNNRTDLDRLLQTATHIAEGCVVNNVAAEAIAVGVKHGNPCGTAIGEHPLGVLSQALDGDAQAIFGGLIMTNFEITEACAELFDGKKMDGIIAPAFGSGVIEKLRRKGNKCRFVANPTLADLAGKIDTTTRFRQVRGGFLLQPNYEFVLDLNADYMDKYGAATTAQKRDMVLAWAVGSTSNSNTITLVKDGMLIGNGVGQQDRVGAAKLAVNRAANASEVSNYPSRDAHNIEGSVAYSDSFFPFPDGPQALIENGVSAIITNSGSMRDSETINLCEKHGIPLYMVPNGIGRGFYGH